MSMDERIASMNIKDGLLAVAKSVSELAKAVENRSARCLCQIENGPLGAQATTSRCPKHAFEDLP